MTFSKISQYLLAVALLPLIFSPATAQKIDEKTYQHEMHLIDSLSFYKMADYDTLYKISVFKDREGLDYKNSYYGWIGKRNDNEVKFIKISGTELEIKKKGIVKLIPVPINSITIDSVIDKNNAQRRSAMDDYGKNYLLSLWLYKKGEFDYSKQLLPESDSLYADTDIRRSFSIIYYDDMLFSLSYGRDYPGAIKWGDHLSGAIFNNYEYQKDAVALARQLKNNPEDFKTFHNPDSLEWGILKQKLSRKEQILYLADRLRLLNCIQDSQPGGISYDMYQFSISRIRANELDISNRDDATAYRVINPFSELLHMKLSALETELLVPYLLTDTYIPSYTYYEDSMPERRVHKLSGVVAVLLFEITNQRFFPRDFDSLPPDEKKAAIDKMKKWCDKNAALSREEQIIKILKTTGRWSDFVWAMETAKKEKYPLVLPLIVKRFNDFEGASWPTDKGVMARTMFEMGNENYIGAVKKWSKDTSDIWVNLWSSLFLLKYDKGSYAPAMNELEAVLKKCDGTSYYPHAMDLLLSMNDKRALELAEGILTKSRFADFIYWDYYLNFIKKLLLLKSDYTFNFINEKLGSFTPEETASFDRNNGNENMLVQSDYYVLAVDKLKGSKPEYDAGGNLKTRLAYKKALSNWFAAQYALLKNGQANKLLLGIVQQEEPINFVDSPH